MSEKPEDGPRPRDLPPKVLRRGTPEYRRTSLVLFVAGYMTFAMLYVVQGILPDVSRDFSVSPAAASLTLSLTTLPLAVAVLVAASWSEGHGRRGAAHRRGALRRAAHPGRRDRPRLRRPARRCGSSPGWCLAGLPAVAMAYVAEEFHPSGLGTAMGLYISGTGLGGMSGRLAGGLIASVANWRVAMAVVGAVCLAGGVWVAAPAAAVAPFRASPPGRIRQRMAGMRGPLRDPVILRFAAVRLRAHGQPGLVLQLPAVPAGGRTFRPAADPGRPGLPALSVRHGERELDGAAHRPPRPAQSAACSAWRSWPPAPLVSLAGCSAAVLVGTAAMVFGFFGAHSVLSGWVSAWGPVSAPSPRPCTCSDTTSDPASPVSSAGCSTRRSAGPARSARCWCCWRSASS